MSDTDNIFEINDEIYYETNELKEKVCSFCNKNFRYNIHRNKCRFKKNDYTYYKLYDALETNYLHSNCFINFLDKNFVNGKLLYDDSEIIKIELFNRLGERMYKKNYIKDVKKNLQKLYNDKFCDDYRLMKCFSRKEHFSFHCESFYFKNDEYETFKNILNEYNEKYKNKGIVIKMKPDDVALFLSK